MPNPSPPGFSELFPRTCGQGVGLSQVTSEGQDPTVSPGLASSTHEAQPGSRWKVGYTASAPPCQTEDTKGLPQKMHL